MLTRVEAWAQIILVLLALIGVAVKLEADIAVLQAGQQFIEHRMDDLQSRLNILERGRSSKQ